MEEGLGVKKEEMNWLERFKGHLSTINHHKIMVMKYCFRAGLYKQGFLHDLSKYAPSEFIPGVRYYQGYRSPNNAQREAEGCSTAWLHHKGRNKHHYEYWIDYAKDKEGNIELAGMKMPINYVIEMFCDRVAASKIYNKNKYTDRDSLDYFLQGRGHYIIHKDTEALLYKMLKMLAEKGEDYTFEYIKNNLKGLKNY